VVAVGPLGPVNVCCGAYPGHTDDCDRVDFQAQRAEHDPIAALTDADRAWLIAHGWDPAGHTTASVLCKDCRQQIPVPSTVRPGTGNVFSRTVVGDQDKALRKHKRTCKLHQAVNADIATEAQKVLARAQVESTLRTQRRG
jgi:hypothetical protein